MAKKALTKKDGQIKEMSKYAADNTIAYIEGPKKKKWTLHDLRNIKPLNPAQRMTCESYFMGNNIVANGFAGTGKSIMGLYLALTDVLREDSPQKYIKIIRSAVPSREIGHLPGDIEEKISVYEQPYRDIINWLCKDRESTYDNMKDAGLVDFKVTSFVRGLTWNDSVIIVDEAQNMTMQEIHSIMTRIGDNTKIFVCGDFTQNDLLVKKSDTSGYREFLQIAKKMSCFDVIEYQKEDIVRSAFVREWILAKED